MGGSPEPAEQDRTASIGCRLAWVSERAIGAGKPGNAGGAKGPHFRQADQRNKGEVIDDESGNSVKDSEVSAEAIREGEAGGELSFLSAVRQDPPGRHSGACLRVGESQRRSTRGGPSKLPGDRSSRARCMAGQPEEGTDRGDVPATTCAAGGDPRA